MAPINLVALAEHKVHPLSRPSTAISCTDAWPMSFNCGWVGQLLVRGPGMDRADAGLHHLFVSPTKCLRPGTVRPDSASTKSFLARFM